LIDQSVDGRHLPVALLLPGAVRQMEADHVLRRHRLDLRRAAVRPPMPPPMMPTERLWLT
jgi:hypothetical protein